MHFVVCFLCALLASKSFVMTMPIPSFRNMLETQQIKDKNSEDFYAAPRIISPGGKAPDSFQNEGDYDSLYNTLKITNNAGNSPASDYDSSSNQAVRDGNFSFSNFYPESSKSKLYSLVKRITERNIRKENFSTDHINAFVPDRSANKLITRVSKLREPDATIESSSETIPLSEVGHIAGGTADLKNIPPMSPEGVQPVDDKLRKPYKEGQNTLKERQFDERREGTSMDEVASGFTLQGTSQQSYQKKTEQHFLDEREQDRGPLLRKQRNTGVFWPKRDLPVLGYGSSDMFAEPEDNSPLQSDMYGLESSTQYFFVPNPIISYGTGRGTYPDMGSINSPEVNGDDVYIPNLPLNSIENNIAVQNYQQNGQPFQFPRPYDYTYQPLSSLANSYRNEIVPRLPAEPTDYLESSPDEDTMSFNKYLPENDNIGFKNQEVLPHAGEINYLTENHDQDYKNKYSYNDGTSSILNQNERSIYPGLFRHNSYVGDITVPALSDSFSSENNGREKHITYNNYKKTKNFFDNSGHENYSSNKETKEEYVGDDHIDKDKGYYSDTEISNSVGQRYSYNYPGTLGEVSNENYWGDSSPLLRNTDVNKVEMRASDVLPPTSFITRSKSDEPSPSFRHFSPDVRPATIDSDIRRKPQHELQKIMKKDFFKNHKNSQNYISTRRNSQMSPYTQDNEHAEILPMQYRTQDSMIDYHYTDFDSDNKNQLNEKHQRKLQSPSQIPHTNVSDNQKLNKRNQDCFEEEETTATGPTETTTLSSNMESTTAEDKLHKNHTSETICKTDFPCSVNGVWYSHTGGVLLCLKTNKDGKLNISILDTPSYYPGHGILSKCWKITGEIPFHPKMKSFISLKATESNEHKFATFIGECFTCENEDVIYGSWLFGRPGRSCKDQHISTMIYKDIFRKSYLHNSKNQCKTVTQKPGA
ncbi:uncharacterized protein LOC126321049 isoform X2 [Schistocerca gregaria]|uniref:uncharacterized protein LOC126321049 isoform X2 n=1 Tax=Schistocerca gregaria TaxID=7010 RepID=UPI00211EC4A7|nr:uncharacterized protein LOC126321049 isoform X2 [Schistocerca gregaria]